MTLRHQNHHHHHSHRRLSTCHRHPTSKPITGFCASCLRERLSSIDSSTSTETTTPTHSPRLRRAKSFSSSNNNAAAASSASEPRRKSCDVGPGNTLSNLFSLEDRKKPNKKPDPTNSSIKLRGEEEEEEEDEEGKEEEKVKISDEFVEEDGELRTMKEFIDLELESKKNTGNFWGTASVFSKKLMTWKHKQQRKSKNHDHKPSSRPIQDIESEIGLYGYFGRRSCDTDPRLSVDNARYSFDEPRASWDGYLIGKAYPKLITPMAALEEKVILGNEGEKSPGGSEQTRNYYGDSLSWQRRRRSFDRSNSGKRLSLVDVDEVKSISNAKVSPETVGLFHGAKLLVTEKELNDSNWYSIKEYKGENVESGSKKNVGYVASGVNQKGLNIKKKLLNMWGFIQKKNESKSVNEEEKFKAVNENVVEKIKRVAKVEMNGNVSEKLIRSYSVSARNSCKEDGLFRGGINVNGGGGGEVKENFGRRRDELLMQRNRGGNVYSPSNLENGLLRFYLTPMRSYRRRKSGGNSRPRNSCSSVMSSGL